MRTYVVEYLDDEGDVQIWAVDQNGVRHTPADQTFDFPEPKAGQIGISLIKEEKPDVVYEGATQRTYQRIAELGVQDVEGLSSQETASLFLEEEHLYEMLEEIYKDFRKKHGDA